MSNHFNRTQCIRLKEMGLPPNIKYGDWYYSEHLDDIALVWSYSIPPSHLCLKLPSPEELEAFAIELAEKQFGTEIVLVIGLHTDKSVCVQIEDYSDNILCDFDPDGESLDLKSLALFALIEKLVEMKE